MFQSVLTIGAILVVAVIVLSLVLLKATSKDSYTGYFPGIGVGLAGLVFLMFAASIDKVEIMGAGLGGWGIASLFAAAIGLIITALADTYANVKA
ncbi:hypothetical protein CAI16_04555 [Virgibacillus dokdonensis]|uniref:Uncharacterized protein n=1 Tax=Virgibacillus dokdonensis TaxID=302167 RepID=A0A3E0WW91_9BACI|nr:hypothetical protein [Virgibacillus dokdonensis]RFA36659.1 hypothetical protein CAI16_04555 [Virgibacillus dokdonensis]